MAGTKVPRDPNLSPEMRRFLDDIARLLDDLNAAVLAPTDASYVTIGANATLTSERVLTAGTLISLTDAGAGSTLTVAYTGQSGGMTRVGTITTTSGTTASKTDLPSAKMFLLQLNGVSHDNGTSRNLRVALSINNGSSYGTPVVITSAAFSAATGVWGCVFIDQVDGGAVHHITPGSIGGIGGTDTQNGAVNALQLSWDGAGNFDAGSAEVYALN